MPLETTTLVVEESEMDPEVEFDTREEEDLVLYVDGSFKDLVLVNSVIRKDALIDCACSLQFPEIL